MANRTTVKSNILTKNVPSVTNAIMSDMLNSELADNIKFREDVAVIQNSGVSNVICNFAGKDRIDLTRTGGTINVSVANIGDGETVFLLVNKTAGQPVTFTGVTDITNVKTYADELTTVLYEIVRKGTNYFARAWVETVKQATYNIQGVMRVATQGECAALSVTDRIVTPGNIPSATSIQKGLIRCATDAEAEGLSLNNIALTPGNMPISSTTQRGVSRIATSAQVDSGTDGTNPGDIAVVVPSELKRKYDAALAYAGFRVAARAYVEVSPLAIYPTNRHMSITGIVKGSDGRYEIQFTPETFDYMVVASVNDDSLTKIGGIHKHSTYFIINLGADLVRKDADFNFMILTFD